MDELDGTWKVTINAWWGFLLRGNIKVIKGNEGHNECRGILWGGFDIKTLENLPNLYYFKYRSLKIIDSITIDDDNKISGQFFYKGKFRATFTMERIENGQNCTSVS